jgi:uncharacterized protein (DUF2147 family)
MASSDYMPSSEVIDETLPKVSFVFDLDGTLVDSVYQHVLAWHRALELEGINLLSVAAALWIAAAVSAPTAQGQEPTAAGLWERVDASGRPAAWFRISDCGGVYEGQIVKIFPKPGEDPLPLRCAKCQGEQKDAPLVGLAIIKGMQRKGRAYENGTILDPRDGSVYSVRMELSPDGNQLTVRGYLGISLLGKSETWKRLPDNALETPVAGACARR